MYQGEKCALCTDRGNELFVPLQHDIDVLHPAQQAEEATAGEERGGEVQLHQSVVF